MSARPAITVIISLYNKRPYIARAVRSVLNQSVTDFEAIVVDDGSTDGSADELVALQTDPRLRVLRQANGGEGAARNRGLREMRADLAAFLDADDEFMPTHLAALLALAARFPSAGMLATAYYGVRQDGSRVHAAPRAPSDIRRAGCGLLDDYFAASWRSGGYFITSSSSAVRRTAVDQAGHFLEGLPVGADIEYWTRIALRFPVAYDAHPTALVYHDVPGSAMSGFKWDAEPPAVIETLSEALGMDRSNRRQSAIDFAAWLLLNRAASGVARLRRREARELLKHRLIRESRFALRPLVLWCAAGFLPDAALRAYLRVRHACAGAEWPPQQ